MGIGMSCRQIFQEKDSKPGQKYTQDLGQPGDTKNAMNEADVNKKDAEMADVSNKDKRGYLNLKTEDHSDSSPPKQEARHKSLPASTEIVTEIINTGGKRATMPNITYKPKEKWGGSVPAFFQTTKQEINIEDTLTPGKRRLSSRPHEFEVRAVNSPGEGTSNEHWEDRFNKESRLLRKRSSQGGKTLRQRVGSVRVEPLRPLKE